MIPKDTTLCRFVSAHRGGASDLIDQSGSEASDLISRLHHLRNRREVAHGGNSGLHPSHGEESQGET